MAPQPMRNANTADRCHEQQVNERRITQRVGQAERAACLICVGPRTSFS